MELLAGKNPALVTGEFGRGRVVACALTIHGKATPTAPGFWNWPDWPKVLGHAVQWAGEARPMRPEKAAGTGLKPISAEELLQLGVETKGVSAEFLARFTAVPTAPVAAAVFSRLFADGDAGKSAALSAETLDALARFAKIEWTEPLLKLADRLNPDSAQRSLALELLGATHSPKAAAILAEALAQPDAAVAATDFRPA